MCIKKNINKQLEEGMDTIRELVESGRALRSKIGIKVRYPLESATIICDKKVKDSIIDIIDLLNEEINVKTISFEKDSSKFLIKSIKPNHSVLGPKYKENVKNISETIEKMDTHLLYEELAKKGKVEITVKGKKYILNEKEFVTVESEKEHFARTEIEDITLFLNTELSEELIAEGFARELVRRIQSMRKELDLDVEDKISSQIKVEKDKIKNLKSWEDYIKVETRSKDIIFTDKPSGNLIKKWKIDDFEIEIGISN